MSFLSQTRTMSGPSPDLTSSVSGNAICRSRFRIFSLSCSTLSMLVRWRPSLLTAIVTQLVTQAAFLISILPSGLSLIAQPVSVGGWLLDTNKLPVLRQYGSVLGTSDLYLRLPRR